MTNPDPGVRRCEHCAFERFDPLPVSAAALADAKKEIGKIAIGDAATGSRRELWKRFKNEQTKTDDLGQNFVLLGVLALGFGTVGELGVSGGVGALAGIGRVGAALLGFGGGLMLPALAMQTYRLRFRDFRPGVAAYDRALARDIVSTLAQQGRMAMSTLAEHLGITRPHLDTVLASLQRAGAATVYLDRKNEMLISLHAVGIDNDACPACGGLLDVSANVRLSCKHCGASSLAAA